jgi:4'-phosphopantetheinyl transferase EntD
MSAVATVPACDVAIDDLFGARVHTAVSRLDAGLADLLPVERAAVLRAVPKRQREFATGRRTARALLAALGHPDVALPRNEDRTVRWPDGVVGTISHSDALCAVAVAHARSAAGLGVDLEPDEPLDRALWSRIATARELETLAARDDTEEEQGRAVRLLFCAKEAFYKSVHAQVGRVLGFHEVVIQVMPGRDRFDAWLAGTPAGVPDGFAFEGRFTRRAGHWIAAATLVAKPQEGSAR